MPPNHLLNKHENSERFFAQVTLPMYSRRNQYTVVSILHTALQLITVQERKLEPVASRAQTKPVLRWLNPPYNRTLTSMPAIKLQAAARSGAHQTTHTTRQRPAAPDGQKTKSVQTSSWHWCKQVLKWMNL